jgi:hypothetical protein
MQDLQEQMDKLRNDHYELNEQSKARSAEVAKEVLNFEELFQPKDVTLEYSGHSITFNRPHPDYSYDKEMFSLSIREGWRDTEAPIKEITVSYYSTNSDSPWELERLMMLGDLARVFVSQKQNLLDKLSEVIVEFGPRKSEILKQTYVLENELRVIKSQEATEKLSKVFKILIEDGLTFENEHVDYLKYKQYQSRVIGARVHKDKPSSKTYNVVLTSKSYYGEETFEYTTERVSEDKLYSLVRNSLEWKAE